MRKAIHLAGCFLVLLGLGCAITNYELITDDDGSPVNTHGKAALKPSSQVGLLWPDGMDEVFWMVDQKTNGDRTLSTYVNHTTDNTFIDWLYCNPDWTGCAVVTAPDPEVGDTNIFDFRHFPNCSGARSVSYLVTSTRYYGECGRGQVSVADRVAILNMGSITVRDGVEGLLYQLNRNSFRIRIDNRSGAVRELPVLGSASAFVDGSNRRMTIDMTDSLLAHTGMGLADFVRNYGTESMTVTFTLNGISKSWHVGPMDPEQITANMNVTY